MTGMFWLGLATPFLVAVMAGVAWLLLQACHAAANRLMRWAHGRLIREHLLPIGYDDAHGWHAAEYRFTEALIRGGGRFRSLPLFGWQVCIVRDRPAPAVPDAAAKDGGAGVRPSASGTHGRVDVE